MKLAEAIEIVDTHQCDMPRNDLPDLIDALKLLIEAGKRIKYGRSSPRGCGLELLPGETKD